MRARSVAGLVLALAAAILAARGWQASAAAGPPSDVAAPRVDGEIERTGKSVVGRAAGRTLRHAAAPDIFRLRRPPPPVIAAVAAVPIPVTPPPPLPDRPPLVLLGTIIGEAVHAGIFHEEATRKTVRLAVGRELRRMGPARGERRRGQFWDCGSHATLVLRPAAQLAMKADPASAAAEFVPPVRHRKR